MEENKMGIVPVPKLLFSMSLPAICSMLLQALYNVVDSIFVSRISEDALAAITLVFPMQMFLMAVGIGTGVGLNSLIARRLGEKRQDAADSAATHGMLLVVFNSIVFLLIGLFTSRPFYSWYSDDPALVDMATHYGQIVLCVSCFLFLQTTCEKILQGSGNMIMPMVSNMIGCVVNIVLDPILIFGLLGAPEMGVIGAAVATVIGQACGCAAVFYCVIKKQNIIHISFKNFKFSWTAIKDIYVVALPGMVMQAIPSFVNIFLNMILITFSVTAVSVMGVYFRLQSFVFMPVFGLCQGSMPIMGYNYGARNRKRLVHTIHLTLKVSITIMAIGLIIFQLFPDQLLAIFDASPQMLHMGRNAMRLLSICFVPAAIGVSFSNLFQALGHGIYSLIMTLIRQLFVILPVAYFLSQTIGVDGVWASFPIAEAAGLTTAILFYRHVYRKEISVLPDGND
ncbi:MAG: MATE family efflux transporter [Anaerovoracaceae bacterium]|nr:MATE family efflux transporter [Bacillota bacterium]MDY2671051.1 MATE family efflux transporter [Anaerovoracaceae bacterium]